MLGYFRHLLTLPPIAFRQTQYLLEGLEVDEEGMRRNLALSRGAVVSEAVMMGLGKTIGRQCGYSNVLSMSRDCADELCCSVAHDIVYDLCRKAQLEDRSLLDLLRQNEEIKKAGLSNGELEKLCDPANYLGLSVEMTDRVLNAETGRKPRVALVAH